MEILRAELNYLSNVKPRSENKVFRDFSLKWQVGGTPEPEQDRERRARGDRGADQPARL